MIKMKKIFLLAAVCGALVCNAQLFPTTNALRDYNNKWIGLSPLESHAQKRLNTLLLGMINWIDSAKAAASGGGSVDLTATNLSISRRPYILSVAQLRTSGTTLGNDTTLFYIRDKGREGIFYYDNADASSPDDTAMIIVSGSKRFKRIHEGKIFPEWWGAKGDGVVDDSDPFNAMFSWYARSGSAHPTIGVQHKKYLLNDTIFLPKVIAGLTSRLRFKWDCDGAVFFKTTTGPMFDRMPATQNEALNSLIGSWTMTIEGMNIEGNSTAGQIGLRLGAFYSLVIEDSHFSYLDTAIAALFCLNPAIERNHFTLNKSIGFKGASGEGYWPLGATNNSAFNVAMIRNNEFFAGDGSYASLYLFATDQTMVFHNIFEGFNPRYDVYNESEASTVVNINTYQDNYFESYGGINGATNTCFYLRNKGTTIIGGIQNDFADTLVRFGSPVAGSHFIFSGIGYWPSTGKVFNADGIVHSGMTMDINNSAFAYSAMFTDTSRWVGGVIGFEVLSLMRDELKIANNTFKISPNSNAATPYNKQLTLDGILFANTDNVNYHTLGGLYNGSLLKRFHTGWFGDGGLWVSPLGKYGFGTASTDADYLDRPVAGRYHFNGTGQMQVPSGTNAQRISGLIGDIRFNTDSGTVEAHNGGGTWLELASRQFVRDNLTSAAGNKFNALSLVDYSGVSDAAVPGSGTNATGTDNTAHIQDMINASASGQLIIIPDGNYRVSGALTNITTKKLNLIVIGNLYVDVGVNFIKIVPPGGAFVQHSIIFLGNAFGMVNIPSHSKANYDAGTGPDWSLMTGVLITLLNVQQVYIQLNKAEGFKAPVELQGSGGAGCQEITVAGRWFYKNANDILITSLDGSSYNDKNTFTGVSGGTLRVSGGCALKVDGYAPAAGNGENFNGATRSNEFHFLIEQADTIAICNSDMTFNTFDVTVENGTNSGIFSSAPWLLRTTFPNNVSGSKFIGRGIFTANQMGSGSSGTMGVNSTIEAMDIWSTGSTTRYGNHAEIDGNGTIVIQANGSLSKANRDAAPAYIKFVRAIEKEIRQDISSSTYTAVTGDRWIYYNHASGTLTLPAANIWVDKYITVYNEHGSAALTVTNVKSGYTTTIIAGGRATYHSNGIDWRD